MSEAGATFAEGDLSAFRVRSPGGDGFAQQRLRWATNAPRIAAELQMVSDQSVRCDKQRQHRFGRPVSSKARASKICYTILKGFRSQLQLDNRVHGGDIGSVCCEEPMLAGDDLDEAPTIIRESWHAPSDSGQLDGQPSRQSVSYTHLTLPTTPYV